MQSSRVQTAVKKLLKGHSELPIPIEAIIRAQGIKLFPYELGEDTSGVLVIEGDVATIGYNSKESPLRNRFTMAHELGHYELHREKQQDLFVDKSFKVMFRGSQSANPAAYKMEREANEFAASLLMPEDLVREEFSKLDLDYAEEDSSISALAKKFGVSTLAMTYRMADLKLLSRNH